MASQQDIMVFVSSTYLDNESRREIVREAIERSEMRPTGMERFTAEANPVVDVCEREARDATIYLGIVASRYGWIPDGFDVSITELEYIAAREAGRPCLMFELDSTVPVVPERDFDDGDDRWDKQKKLDVFKTQYKEDGNTPGRFTDDNLTAMVMQALQKWRNENLPAKPASATPRRKQPGSGVIFSEDNSQVVVVESLMARLDRTDQRDQLAQFLDTNKDTTRPDNKPTAVAIGAPGESSDSAGLFALCCLDTFATAFETSDEEELLELLRDAASFPLLPDHLVGNSERLGRALTERLEKGGVPADGWAVFFSSLKSEKRALKVSDNFNDWRERARQQGCRRKVLLVLVWDEFSLASVGRRVASFLQASVSLNAFCKVDRLQKIDRKHVTDWRTYLRDRKHPMASRLSGVVQKLIEDRDSDIPMEEFREIILSELESRRR